MPLPILTLRPEPPRPSDLVRFFHRTELHWCRQLAEESPLDVGTAILNAPLATIADANEILDAALPDGLSPAQALQSADAHFAASGLRCLNWTINPSSPANRTHPLAEHLLSLGFERRTSDILYLYGQPGLGVREVCGLTIIPARASFRHARQLAERQSDELKAPAMADAIMLHLEDAQTDSLLAIENNEAIALAAVLTVGDIGRIEQMYVSPTHRRRGIGRTMLSRAMEICARSLFKHVFARVEPKNQAAQSLFQSVGFKKAGDYISYHAPPKTL